MRGARDAGVNQPPGRGTPDFHVPVLQAHLVRARAHPRVPGGAAAIGGCTVRGLVSSADGGLVMKTLSEIGAVFAALGVLPLGPLLAASHAGLAWEALALTAAWAFSWYVWLASRLRRE